MITLFKKLHHCVNSGRRYIILSERGADCFMFTFCVITQLSGECRPWRSVGRGSDHKYRCRWRTRRSLVLQTFAWPKLRFIPFFIFRSYFFIPLQSPGLALTHGRRENEMRNKSTKYWVRIKCSNERLVFLFVSVTLNSEPRCCWAQPTIQLLKFLKGLCFRVI